MGDLQHNFYEFCERKKFTSEITRNNNTWKEGGSSKNIKNVFHFIFVRTLIESKQHNGREDNNNKK